MENAGKPRMSSCGNSKKNMEKSQREKKNSRSTVYIIQYIGWMVVSSYHMYIYVWYLLEPGAGQQDYYLRRYANPRSAIRRSRTSGPVPIPQVLSSSSSYPILNRKQNRTLILSHIARLNLININLDEMSLFSDLTIWSGCSSSYIHTS